MKHSRMTDVAQKGIWLTLAQSFTSNVRVISFCMFLFVCLFVCLFVIALIWQFEHTTYTVSLNSETYTRSLYQVILHVATCSLFWRSCCTHILACYYGEFQCNNGQCVPISYRCNGFIGECSDESDELHCGKFAILTCSYQKVKLQHYIQLLQVMQLSIKGIRHNFALNSTPCSSI